jgi:hypothetical protein
MYRQESGVQANERRSSLLQVCEAEGSPSDASFEIKFINVKYMQMGSGALEMGLCSRRDICLRQPNMENKTKNINRNAVM